MTLRDKIGEVVDLLLFVIGSRFILWAQSTLNGWMRSP